MLPPGWATDLILHTSSRKRWGVQQQKSLVLVQLSSSLQRRRRGRKCPNTEDFLWLLSEDACRGPSSELQRWNPRATAVEHLHCCPGALPMPGQGDCSCICWCHWDGDTSWGHFCGVETLPEDVSVLRNGITTFAGVFLHDWDGVIWGHFCGTGITLSPECISRGCLQGHCQDF